MLTLTQIATLLAKYSLGRWNKSRLLRKLCRMAYQGMGEAYAIWHEIRKGMSVWGECVREKETAKEEPIRPTESEERKTFSNTYPWPYVDEGFANWPPSDEKGEDALVCDPAGFVVKHCTSYCAWKIRELTGHWPKVRQSGAVYHAKDWEEFLAKNGFTKRVDTPEDEPRGRFVGMCPDQGEYGQLYWFEEMRYVKCAWVERGVQYNHSPPVFDCTTYYEGQFANISMSKSAAEGLRWVQVG